MFESNFSDNLMMLDITDRNSPYFYSEDFTLKDLNTFTNNKFNWTIYFKQLFAYAEVNSIEVNENLVVKVLDTNNLRLFVELVTNETKE